MFEEETIDFQDSQLQSDQYSDGPQSYDQLRKSSQKQKKSVKYKTLTTVKPNRSKLQTQIDNPQRSQQQQSQLMTLLFQSIILLSIIVLVMIVFTEVKYLFQQRGKSNFSLYYYFGDNFIEDNLNYNDLKATGIIFNGTVQNFIKICKEIQTDIPLYYKLDLLKTFKSINNTTFNSSDFSMDKTGNINNNYFCPSSKNVSEYWRSIIDEITAQPKLKGLVIQADFVNLKQKLEEDLCYCSRCKSLQLNETNWMKFESQLIANLVNEIVNHIKKQSKVQVIFEINQGRDFIYWDERTESFNQSWTNWRYFETVIMKEENYLDNIQWVNSNNNQNNQVNLSELMEQMKDVNYIQQIQFNNNSDLFTEIIGNYSILKQDVAIKGVYHFESQLKQKLNQIFINSQ